MDQEAFILTPYMAQVFFRAVMLYKIGQDYDRRMALMRKIVARKKGVYLRDVKPFLAGKKVIKINSKELPPNA